MGKSFRLQAIPAFPESWVALTAGVPETWGVGSPAHKRVPSHKEKPEGTEGRGCPAAQMGAQPSTPEMREGIRGAK